MDSSSSDEEVLSSIKRGTSSTGRLLDAEESDPSIGSGSDGEAIDINSDKGSRPSESDENDEQNQSNFESKKKKKPPDSGSNDKQTLNKRKSQSPEASDEEDLMDEQKYTKTKKVGTKMKICKSIFLVVQNFVLLFNFSYGLISK